MKDPVSGRSVTDYQGSPDRYPPVTVNNTRQEEYHAAQGYVPAGSPNPQAWVEAAAPVPPDYVPDEYPKWVGDRLVKNANEEEEITGNAVKAVVAAPDGDLARKKAARSAKIKATWERKKAEKAAQASA